MKKVYIGYILMLLGIILPLYAFSSLSFNELSENMSFRQFIKESSLSDVSIDKELLEDAKKYNTSLYEGGIVDPFDTSGYSVKYELSGYEDGDIFAYLNIPKLELKKPIRLGASKENLAKGLAHVDGTALPIGGEGTRSVIAGHRGTHKDLFFLNLDELEIGDMVYVEGKTGELTYTVYEKEVIMPYEWEKLMPIEGEDILTLLTCEPFAPPRPYRLLIHCKRVDNTKKDLSDENLATTSSLSSQNNRGELASTSTKAKSSFVYYLKMGMYLITLILWLLFISTLIRFIREILATINNKEYRK